MGAVAGDDGALDLASGDFTVEGWASRGEGASGVESLLCKLGGGAGWALSLDGAALRWDDGANTLSGGSFPVDGLWHHVALTHSATTGNTTLWLDGASVGSGLRASPAATTLDLGLGACADGSQGWVGDLDDLRVSAAVLYTGAFLPGAPFVPLASTVALWGMEEASGTVVHDLSSQGRDAAFVPGDAAWTTNSDCSVNLAPTAPSVTVSPALPVPGQDLECALVAPAVDPEGAPLSYQGQWLIDGLPGPSFTGLPATVAGTVPEEGENWTCEAWADDGVRQGPSDTESVFYGAEPVCTFSTPAATAATTTCGFVAPTAGRLRFTMQNPDGSRDGVFLVDAGTLGTTRIGTGFRDWSYAGDTVSGWTEFDVEWNLSPGMGNVTLTLSYDPQYGPDLDGVDTLAVDFVYGGSLSTVGASLLLESAAVPTQNTVHQVATTFPSGQRLLVEAVTCGFGGGAQGLYGDTNATPGDDGFFRMDTGWTETCTVPLRSLPWPAGAVTFTVGNEDDYFADNTGTRTLRLWRGP
jgi:hypothetical protein